MSTKDSNPKDVIGCTKPSLSAVPCAVLFMLGAAMTEGTRYGRHNYRVVGVRASIYYDAAMRHIMAYWEGEDIDPDSGLPHLVKAMACLTIMLDADGNEKLTDDRPPAMKGEWMKKAQLDTAKVLANIKGKVLPPYTQVRLDKAEGDNDDLEWFSPERREGQRRKDMGRRGVNPYHAASPHVRDVMRRQGPQDRRTQCERRST